MFNQLPKVNVCEGLSHFLPNFMLNSTNGGGLIDIIREDKNRFS